MRCKRIGCGNKFRGASRCRIVEVEDKRNRQVSPRQEVWCLECCQVLEPHKYTLVYSVDGKTTRMSRVPRKDVAQGLNVKRRIEEQAPIIEMKETKPVYRKNDASSIKKIRKTRRKTKKPHAPVEDTSPSPAAA